MNDIPEDVMFTAGDVYAEIEVGGSDPQTTIARAIMSERVRMDSEYAKLCKLLGVPLDTPQAVVKQLEAVVEIALKTDGVEGWLNNQWRRRAEVAEDALKGILEANNQFLEECPNQHIEPDLVTQACRRALRLREEWEAAEEDMENRHIAYLSRAAGEVE